MVRWKDLKLNQQMSKRDRFNFIMNYIDSATTEEPVVEEVVQTGSIAVSVTDGENGIGSVSVVLSQTGNETTYTGNTGGQGGCNIKDVPYGTYDVTATKEGYVTGETTITVDSENEELNIELTLETQNGNQEEEPTG